MPISTTKAYKEPLQTPTPLIMLVSPYSIQPPSLRTSRYQLVQIDQTPQINPGRVMYTFHVSSHHLTSEGTLMQHQLHSSQLLSRHPPKAFV